MARKARLVAPGIPHHITQRGNNRQDVFRSNDDRRFYLDTLRDKGAIHGVSLLGYCLLSNHVHEPFDLTALGNDDGTGGALRDATQSGLPLGDAAFIDTMERRFTRKLRRQPPRSQAEGLSGPGLTPEPCSGGEKKRPGKPPGQRRFRQVAASPPSRQPSSQGFPPPLEPPDVKSPIHVQHLARRVIQQP